MRKPVAQRIRDEIIHALNKKGREFSKAEYRKAKRFYSTIPWNKREGFNVI